MSVVSCLFVKKRGSCCTDFIYSQFGSTKLVRCPESRRSTRGRLLLCTYNYYSDFNPYHLIEREKFSSDGRICYGRFHCTSLGKHCHGVSDWIRGTVYHLVKHRIAKIISSQRTLYGFFLFIHKMCRDIHCKHHLHGHTNHCCMNIVWDQLTSKLHPSVHITMYQLITVLVAD